MKEREKAKMTLLLSWIIGVMLIYLSENEIRDQVLAIGSRDKLSLRVYKVV